MADIKVSVNTSPTSAVRVGQENAVKVISSTTGSQGVQGGQGLQGVGSQGPQGVQGQPGLYAGQGTQGTQGLGNQGIQGIANQGVQGVPGSSSGIKYTFNTSTTIENPGSGYFRFDSSNLESIGEIAVSNISSDGLGGYSDYILSWGDSTNTDHRGVLTIVSNDPGINSLIIFKIIDQVQLNSGWLKIYVERLSGNIPQNNELCSLIFYRTGDIGSQGVQGFQGLQSTQGNQGLQGGGSQGPQGPQGIQGLQGLQGLQGISVQGVQGPAGPAGGGGGSVTIKDEGSVLGTAVTSINFVGSGVAATGNNSEVTVTISGGGGGGSDITVKDEGTIIGTAATTFNFVGSGVVATYSAGITTVTISGGGGGGDIVTRTVSRTVATEGQTVFNRTYDVGYIDVFMNGTKLDSTEYTATNGTTVVLGTGATANDIIETIAFESVGITSVTVSDDSSPQLGGDLDLNSYNIVGVGNVNITGIATVTGGQLATQADAIAYAIALG